MTTAEASALLEPRYGADHGGHILVNDVVSTLLAHKSVRAFEAAPLEAGVLETLVAAAQSAATSSNLQAWSVVSVEDPARRARLAELCNNQGHIVQAPMFLVWLADLARLKGVGERAQSPAAALDYLETFLVAVVDAALAAQNAAVAAESLGLGIVYIGAMRNHPEAVAEVLGLPPRVFAVFGMCVGVPKRPSATTVKPRLPQDVVLHRDVYGDAAPERVGAFDETLKAHQASQGMRAAGWTGQAIPRVLGPQSMSGRHRLREALSALGFDLT